MRKTFLTLACLLLATMGWAQTDTDHNFKVAKNLEVFNTIYRNLDMMYVDTLDADEVVGYGINSMLHSLDPYTEYYPEDKSKDVKMMLITSSLVACASMSPMRICRPRMWD